MGEGESGTDDGGGEGENLSEEGVHHKKTVAQIMRDKKKQTQLTLAW